VDVGIAFNLTCTAYTAADAVDTAFASQVDITDDNSALSLLLVSTGLAFTKFDGTDFVNGTVTKSVKWSGTITSDQAVIISGVKNGATLPKGQVNQTVTYTPVAYWLEGP